MFINFYCVLVGVAVLVFEFIKLNTKLIIIAEAPINISQIIACLRIVNHFLYLLSSPAAVTIWKPPQIRIIIEISPKNHNIQFTAVCTNVINDVSHVHQVCHHTTHIVVLFWLVNQFAVVNIGAAILLTHKIAVHINTHNFLFIFNNIV